MGFQQPANNVRNFNNGNAANQGGNPQWAADAYVNIYLPKRNGNRAKLGSLKLNMNRRNDQQVIEYLQNAPYLEEALASLKDRLVIDFVNVGEEPEESEKLDLA